jgi:hypothetical protein
MQSRSRWPEWPHPKHRTSPRQSATKWSDDKHRKQRPKVLCLKARGSPASFLGGGAATFSSLGRRRPPTSSQACSTVAMESTLTIVGLKFTGSLSGGGGSKSAGAGAAGASRTPIPTGAGSWDGAASASGESTRSPAAGAPGAGEAPGAALRAASVGRVEAAGSTGGASSSSSSVEVSRGGGTGGGGAGASSSASSPTSPAAADAAGPAGAEPLEHISRTKLSARGGGVTCAESGSGPNGRGGGRSEGIWPAAAARVTRAWSREPPSLVARLVEEFVCGVHQIPFKTVYGFHG